ncbi:helix-turn-helix domain-containing protein [Novosphingobium cyanobacteriorum]|uniref:Helix-turn-helix domain-containing protein n=1 Tax=Novosphingobium cyanobacteriorum TaxID=3024215 RepID=A0ABT6CMH5_9SPHN|nr:helix-turn-helix domain-containing protein [Novosphingobium cyanobacteriorum]MDF8335113.1 helix-turn-helix domain-containing protein [Novosphingobium cyanobacteriorum]
MDNGAAVHAWSSQDVNPRGRYDAWVDQLNSTFGYWRASQTPAGDFDATIRARSLGSLNVISCQCDPCGGERKGGDIVRETDPQERLIIQLVEAGQEHMKLGAQEAILHPGDIFIWDNTQTMQFTVLERLSKVSVALPLNRLKDWLPQSWRNLPRCIKSGEPGSDLLAGYVRSLVRIDHSNNPMRYDALVDAAVAMIVASQSGTPEQISHKGAQLDTVKAKIRQRLQDPDLTLEAIAVANRISLRYLHWLFEGSGQTAWQFISTERLAGCKRDLANPAFAGSSVFEIGLRWGFGNAAHFSRKFKAHAKLSPSEFRSLSMTK